MLFILSVEKSQSLHLYILPVATRHALLSLVRRSGAGFTGVDGGDLCCWGVGVSVGISIGVGVGVAVGVGVGGGLEFCSL